MTTYLLAGGGTAGHVNPLLAVGDLLRERDGDDVLVLGTREGLESRLVPARGYRLLIVDKVPFPRRPNRAALAFPARFRRAVAQVRAHIRTHGVDVVVGFGGYAAAPAYVAARRERIPFVVHEANAKPGLANELGARRAAGVGVAFEGTPLKRGEVVGMPLRREVVELDRAASRAEAAEEFGLDADRPVLLVFGGSLGALRLNEAFAGAWRDVLDYFRSATHLGLTATPKETKDVSNITYFGEPVYTYSLKQGIEDGFLAPYKVIRIATDADAVGYTPETGKLDKHGQAIAFLALGRIAHDTLLSALGARRAAHKFGHGAEHELPDGRRLFDSYHCSRYNTNTGVLTTEMFEDVVGRAARFVGRG